MATWGRMIGDIGESATDEESSIGWWLESGWRVAGDGVKLTTAVKVADMVAVLVVEELKATVMERAAVTAVRTVMVEAAVRAAARSQLQ